jgi:hypothetical protein
MGTWNFSYDAVDRLTSAAAGSNAPTAFRSQSAAWGYDRGPRRQVLVAGVGDSYGNRTAQTFSNSVVSNWMNYNPANNRITTATSAVTGYVYDGVPVDRSSSTGRDTEGAGTPITTHTSCRAYA